MSLSYRREVMADSPVMYLRTGEKPAGGGLGSITGQTAFDETANNNSGTYNGSVTGGYAGPISSDPNTSVVLQGPGSAYIGIPHATSLNVADVFTYELWLLRGATSSLVYLMGKGSSAPVLYFNAANALVLRKNGVADVVASTTTIADSSLWHHVVATKSGATSKLYIDSVDRTGAVTNQTMTNTTLDFGVGQPGPLFGSNFFDGWVDEVAVYNTALSASRVLTHYQAGVLPILEMAGMAIM